MKLGIIKVALSVILSKFRQQCQANAPQNEGILIPAHLVGANYLQGLGPVKRKVGAGGY